MVWMCFLVLWLEVQRRLCLGTLVQAQSVSVIVVYKRSVMLFPAHQLTGHNTPLARPEMSEWVDLAENWVWTSVCLPVLKLSTFPYICTPFQDIFAHAGNWIKIFELPISYLLFTLYYYLHTGGVLRNYAVFVFLTIFLQCNNNVSVHFFLVFKKLIIQ